MPENDAPFAGEHTDLSEKERDRVAKDVMHWKTEYEQDTGFSDEEFDEYLSMLQEMDDTELINHWFTTVGEWVCHRGELPWPARVGNDTYLSVQLGKVLAGQDTDYGFIVSVSV